MKIRKLMDRLIECNFFCGLKAEMISLTDSNKSIFEFLNKRVVC